MPIIKRPIFPTARSYNSGQASITRIEPRTVEVGISAGWDAVEYFLAANDLSINADGIGRTGSTNFGSGWLADTMSFWVSGVVLGNMDFVLEYEWKDSGGGYGRNKHGMAWWTNNTQHGAGLAAYGTGVGWIGTWDPLFNNQEMLVNGVQQSTSVDILPGSPVGIWVYRRIARTGNAWTVSDGVSYGDDTYGLATMTSSATVGPLVGITMAGTHRFRRLAWTWDVAS